MIFKSKLPDIPTAQRDMVARLRGESCLDPSFPLGGCSNPRPEHGPTIERYYAWKHTIGPGPGRFFPLHKLALYHA